MSEQESTLTDALWVASRKSARLEERVKVLEDEIAELRDAITELATAELRRTSAAPEPQSLRAGYVITDAEAAEAIRLSQ
jgi:cell division protein FtsB